MSLRRKKSTQSFRWISALFFNFLMVGFAIVMGQLMLENRKALGEEYITSSEAVAATRNEMDKMFADLVPPGADRREFWANEISKQLREDDLTTAHGLLMAAPAMLDKQDASAVLAAAQTEDTGSLDARLLSAATLFLPDDVRARYERATAPSDLESLSIATEVSETADETLPSETTAETAPVIVPEAEPETTAFFVLGNERDLAYQSAGWIRGDKTDVFSLSISGLGLAAQREKLFSTEFSESDFRGASLVKTARRAKRLTPEFSQHLQQRLENALPPERLRAALETTFSQGGSLLIPDDAILDAFVYATDEDRLGPFLSDLERIAQFTKDRPESAALVILETVSSRQDLKRAELMTFAGGDRAVALAKYYGPEALNSAQTVMDWSMRLIGLIMASVALLLVLFWIALSTFFASFNRGDSLSHHYGYGR